MRANSPEEDACKHGWCHDGSPGDHCDQCLVEDTLIGVVEWLRNNPVVNYVPDVRFAVADAIEKHFLHALALRKNERKLS